MSCRVGLMDHIDWGSDELAVAYVPKPGQYIWVDMPDSLKAPLVRWRLASFAGTEWEVPAEREDEISKAMIEGFHEGEPWLIQWPE